VPAPAPAQLAALVGAVAVWVLAAGGPALAHPLGPPPEVGLRADGRTVEVTWRAERDDVYAIALSVGAVAGELIFEEVNGEVVQVGGERDADLLASDPAVPAYLLDTIGVQQDGVACSGDVLAPPTYDGEPAHLTFSCPRPVAAVDVTVSALTEISDAYRTIARAEGADPARGLHTAEAPTATYAFAAPAATAGRTAAEAPTSGSTVALAAGTGGLVCAAAAVALLGRRRRGGRQAA
jgi:hypothetical protein